MQRGQHSGRALRGSQLHLQNLINDEPEYLNCLILSSSAFLRTYAATHPKWVSPLASANYIEYQDKSFLEAIGFPQLLEKLSEFWPLDGPVWDALATFECKSGNSGVILLEAKSYIGELEGPGCRASSKSCTQINRSLATVKQALSIKATANWPGKFYQYANRLAHLYFLNVVAEVPTWMVFLYFVGDVEQDGPLTVAEWEPALDEVKRKLGLPEHHLLDQRIVSAFTPVWRRFK